MEWLIRSCVYIYVYYVPIYANLQYCAFGAVQGVVRKVMWVCLCDIPLYVYMYVKSVCMCVCMCVYVCMYACMCVTCVCVYACMCVCVYVCMYSRTWVHFKFACLYIRIYLWTGMSFKTICLFEHMNLHCVCYGCICFEHIYMQLHGKQHMCTPTRKYTNPHIGMCGRHTRAGCSECMSLGSNI
jgi:hypothetical protein